MMFFGDAPTDEAIGAILAHSLRLKNRIIKKGTVLKRADIDAILGEGIAKIKIARLDESDLGENEAAKAIGEQLITSNIIARAPFSGRVNLIASEAGVFDYGSEALLAMNEIDQGVTAAFLRPNTVVTKGQMVGTIKIIPYGVCHDVVNEVLTLAEDVRPTLAPFRDKSVNLIITTTKDMKPSVVVKGEKAVEQRLLRLDQRIQKVITCDHNEFSISEAVQENPCDLLLILTAYATSDRADVGPAAVAKAGGEVSRFGIPVDPGNLLFMGERGTTKIVGLPGCVRAPAINGADFVLERLVAGLEITDTDFAQMAIGGLLKEAPSRPQPRAHRQSKSKMAGVILASGQSSRMNGKDKLMEEVGGKPILSHLIDQAKQSQLDDVYVVLPTDGFDARRQAAKGTWIIENPFYREGMGASIRLATQQLAENHEAIMFILGDMPEITAQHINAILAAYSPDDQREIVQAASETGAPGHPVLFGQRFFENLMQAQGDVGAKKILHDGEAFLEIVRMKGEAPVIDLDTEEAWQNWRKKGEMV